MTQVFRFDPTPDTAPSDICMGCGSMKRAGGRRDCGPIGESGWIDETWDTVGGGRIRRVLCFPCRNIVILSWRTGLDLS